ncbi:MAG: immune inhibitor A [Chloroflexi bacterium]|nr:immune inhibitor A [Chloroflexota bacterium]
MTRKKLLLVVAILGVCLCLVIAALGALAFPQTRELIGLYQREAAFVTATPPQVAQASPTPAPRREIITPPLVVFGTPTPRVIVTPTPLAQTPLASVSRDTLNALERVKFLPRDLFQIAPRFKKNLTLATPTLRPRARQVGDKENFNIAVSTLGGKYRTASATLQVISPHAYFWVEDGGRADLDALNRSADFFEKNIYPTNHKYFGSERIPGPDGDTRIHIFNGKLDSNTGGYYSSTDTYPTSIAQFSNQRHIIYINSPSVALGSSQYYATLAHEFQHLIHNSQAGQKAGWIDEGLGDLAVKLNGFPAGSAGAFAEKPETQLNTWAGDPNANAAHYGASYLFFNYLASRFGPDLIRDVVLAPCEGICAVQSALNKRAQGAAFDEIFADWTVANILNDASIENGRYSYPNEGNFRVTRQVKLSDYPAQFTTTIHPYATNYYSLQPIGGDVTVSFTGTTTTKLIPTNPPSGRWLWYSNRADLSNMHLTREVDLTRVPKATLQFSAWHDIEKDFDYAYVEVSTDGGKTWETLRGKTTTNDDPNGANFGNGFTGKSGTADEQLPAQWVPEQIDLTPFAGKKFLLRFEYITDDALNQPGFAVDDIAIPEINFADDVEKGAEGWTASGFVRVDNVLPQKFIIQVVQIGSSTRIARIPLDALNRGSVTITGFNNLTSVQVIVTAEAPTTTEATDYQLAVTPK